MHLNRERDEGLVREDNVQQEREQDDGRDNDRDDHVRSVFDEPDLESAGEYEVGRVGGDEDCGGNVRHGELGVDPRSWVDNVARHPRHVGEEGRAGQDNGVVPNEGAQAEEEGIEVEEQSVPHLASLLQHLKCQVPDQTGSIDRDGDVCQREEESHDVDRGDVVRPEGTSVHFFLTNGQDGKQEEICYQGCRYKVHGEVQSHER